MAKDFGLLRSYGCVYFVADETGPHIFADTHGMRRLRAASGFLELEENRAAGLWLPPAGPGVSRRLFYPRCDHDGRAGQIRLASSPGRIRAGG